MKAPFRIYRWGQPGVTLQTAPTVQDELRLYTDRLLRLIPAEVVAAYTAGRGIRPEYVQYWAPICSVLLLVIRTWGTKDAGRSPQVGAIAVAFVSFVLWVYAMGDHFLGLKIADQAIASMAMIAWIVVLPVFYKGEQ